MFTWTPSEAQGPGSYTFDIEVTDNTTLTDTETITVTVTETNTAPILTTPGDQALEVGTTLSFTAIASDSDVPANALTFTLAGAPAGAFIDPTTGAFTWTPAVSGAGNHTFDVIVTDSGSPSLNDTETITVTATATNHAPVLATIGTQHVDEHSALTFTASATDPDGDMLTYTLTDGTSGAVPAGASIDPASGVFTWTPTETQDGTHRFDVIVSDGGSPSLTDRQTVLVQVVERNEAPQLTNPGNRTDVEGNQVSLQLVATDTDIPADRLTWQASGLPAGLVLNSTTGTISGTVAAGTAATSPHNVTIVVNDNAGGTTSVSFVWMILPTVTPPLQVAPIAADDRYSVGLGARLSVTVPGVLGNDRDPDGDQLTARIVTEPLSGSVDLSTNGSFVYVHDGASTDPDFFVYEITDADGQADRATVRIDVINVAPIARDDTFTMLEDETLDLNPLANDTDPEGGPLFLTGWETPTAGSIQVMPNNSIRFRPPADFHGVVSRRLHGCGRCWGDRERHHLYHGASGE